MRPNYFDFGRYRWRGTYPPAGECDACRMLAELFAAAGETLRLWQRRVRARQELAGLDARALRDIGVTPGDADRECAKPFWRE